MRYDLAIVGGGTAALIAAHGGAAVGARVALIERHRVGGDCLWTGCVPSKALIAAAATAHAMRHADRHGLDPVDARADLARVMATVRAAQAVIEPHDSPDRLRAAGVDVIAGHGRFTSGHTLDAGGTELRFRRALIATGAQPAIPPIDGMEHIAPLTSDSIWQLRELPARLVVIGGGPIGCELGQAFSRLGAKVTIVEALPRLLAREIDAAGALIADRLRAEGVSVLTGAKAIRIEAPRNGSRALIVERDGETESIPFDELLVATGRRAATRDLGLDAAGVELDDRGYVRVDARLRTTASDIFAAGDVTGAMPFTHVAAYQARLVVTNALFGLRRKASYESIPSVTFTDPEVARVGIDATEARQRWGPRAKVQRFDYASLDRAITVGDATGFAELVADPRGRLAGATIVGAAAGDSIAELTAWLVTGTKIGTISQTVHAYPTFSEGASRAADDVLRAKYFSPRMKRITRAALGLRRIIDRFSTHG